MKPRTIEEQNEQEEAILEEIEENGHTTREDIIEEQIRRMEEEGNPHI